MLFHEIYGSYFHAVAAVLTEASEKALTDKRMTELVAAKAFAESTLSIPTALRQEAWPLLDRDLHTVIRQAPSTPLTILEKRWLKALLLDPRIALFAPDTAGLEDVEPLYQPDTFVRFDQYSDGDPYADETYIACFRTVLQAIHERKMLRIRFRGHTGARHSLACTPYRLEYSAKDDKFRLLAAGKRSTHIVNLARVRSCEPLDEYIPEDFHLPQLRTKELTMQLYDERNALERVLLHFSHFEKETRRLSDGSYQIKLLYDADDEIELLIRVLSFGPVLKVLAPTDFVNLLKERLSRQGCFFSSNIVPSQ